MKLVPKPVSANRSWVRPDVKLPGKTVIITGANTGIGLWTAVDLAKREAKVIIACRNAEKAEEARIEIIKEAKCPKDKVIVKKLDLSSFASIKNFAADINETEDRLDVLINNAGVMMCPNSETEDGFETHFAVNHLGHFLLTNLLLDLLKKSAPSRIVVLSSIAYLLVNMNFDDLNSRKSYRSWAVYSRSKLANLLFTWYLAKRLQGTAVAFMLPLNVMTPANAAKVLRHLHNSLIEATSTTSYCVAGTGVTINSVQPGLVDTSISRHVDHSVGNYFWKFVSILARTPGIKWLIGLKTPEHGAQTSVYCAVAPELIQVSGRCFSDCRAIEVNAAAKNDLDAERLWNVSLEMTKLKQC